MSLRSLAQAAAALAVLLSPAAFPVQAQLTNGITREVYLNITGSTVATLTNAPAFPNSPGLEEVLTNSIDCPVNALENYGTRLRALITPPTSGDYVFWIASDDNSVLYLGTNSSAASKVAIATVNSSTTWKQWTKETNQQSGPVTLVGGQQYYLEALQKEGTGGDNLSVRWQLPGGVWEVPADTNAPIPAMRCVPVGVVPPLFTQVPASLTVVEGSQVNFTAAFIHDFSATRQWQRNGTNIPGANGTNYLTPLFSLADNGHSFRFLASNLAGASITTNAIVTVVADATPPSISSAGNLGDLDVVTVVFSEPVEAATAAVAGNYTLDNGVSVLGAAMGLDDRTVTLTTTPMVRGVTYTLRVSNVRDLASVPNTIPPNTPAQFAIASTPLDISFLKPRPEPMGPSTRRGPLVISEVMYHPTNRLDARNAEFVEIYNSNPWFEELGGYRISGGIDYTFPSNFILQARSYAVIAANPADLQAVYGVNGALGPWTGNLNNGGDTLRLRNKQDAILFEMTYSTDPPFPPEADGAGHSLVLARPSYGEGDARAWGASDVIGGTPGTNEVAGVNPFRAVLINEFLAHTDLPDLDYIELFNYSTGAVNLGGCVLTDEPDTNKFVFPPGTIIPANGFLVYYETNLGFGLGAGGETIYLKNPEGTRVLDAVRFEAQENGAATGRFPDGAPDFHRLQSPTPGAANSPIRRPTVVINELMYEPLSQSDDEEFIELYNPGTNAVNVGKWRLKDAVKFTIPAGTVIPANGYLVIAAKSSLLRSNYAHLNTNNCLGDWEGSLRNRGERVALTMPDQILGTNGLGQPVTNTIHIVMDEVTYSNGGRWGNWSEGGGSSLELKDWRSNRRLAPNWADSVETNKSGWVNVEATGVLDNGWSTAHQLHITLLGAGEALIDNIELIQTSFVTNLIGNGSFENGTEGWTFQGNHNETSLETTEGFPGGTKSLHIRARGRGDSGANRIRYTLPFTLTSGVTVTLRAKVRWLAGNPNILLRVRGNYHEAPGFMVTARNLGTPGLVNTVATTNAPPAIHSVAHWPPLPATNQPALVTARVDDPDGLATLLLRYRIDPSTNFTALAMTNNGAGLFSAVIPGQPSNTVVAFHVVASDKLNPARAASFPGDAPNRECVIDWGDNTIPGTLPTYRFWLTQRIINQWAAEEKMSNKPKDATFIYGTNRVVYNAGAWFHGSPYHSPGYNTPVGANCDYDLGFPNDDRLFGETDINLFRPGNGGGDTTGQKEIHAYWFGGQLGVPFLFHRPVFVYVNGQRRNGTIYHDAQQPNGDFVDQWYPDEADQSELHKIMIGFEFGDTAYGNGEAGYGTVGANFNRYTTTGGAYKTARYRSTLPWRSASPFEQNNYSNIFALVESTMTSAAINTPPYTTTLSNRFNIRDWYKTDVVQHLINNTDSFSYGGGQNAFMVRRPSGRWNLLLWDIDFAFGGSGSDSNLTSIGGADHGPRNDHVPFNRIYWQTLREAAYGMMLPSRSDTLIDARYSGLVAAGAGVASPSSVKTHISLKRALLLNVLATNDTAPFEIQSNGGADFSASNNLVTLSGRAMLAVDSIEVNGVRYAPTWGTTTNWSIVLALAAGTNTLNVTARDAYGNAVSNAADTITITVTAPPSPPQDYLVINEIMARPFHPDGEFVELFNTSSNVTFDISHWRLDGVNYEFPDGVLIAPRAYVVVARDLAAFAGAYGTNVVPVGAFGGNLQSGGETLTLVKPGATPAADVVVSRIRYDNASPWPGVSDGASYQLVDAQQDGRRVGNWSAVPGSTTGWRFASATGVAGPGVGGNQMRLAINLGLGDANGAGVVIDDIAIVPGTVAGLGTNYVRNGDFETGPLLEVPALTNSWFIGTNYTNTVITGDVVHSGAGALKIVCQTFGNAQPRLISQLLSPAPLTNAVHTLSFWFNATNTATNLSVRLLNSGALSVTTNVQPATVALANLSSPGASNQTARLLTPFPGLWINEIEAENLSGPADSSGEREPWIELYNAGTNAAALDGLFLSSNYTALTQWAFPTGTVINPGEFRIVFCDGEPAETTNGELHTSFRLPAGAGSIALSRLSLLETQVLDYVNYRAGPDHSFGSFPDGQPFTRFEMYYVTPGLTNNGTLPPANVFINEWMADNVGALPDPADGNYEDWFEIFNPGSNYVSLAGYFLTDVLTNKFKYEIPPGYGIPPGGYLLVWADGETGQNGTNSTELHAGFNLARNGEAIGLFTPDGIQIDAVTFGLQQADVAGGRFPDGAANVLSLTNYTPGSANYYPLPNVAPMLAFIPNKFVAEGGLLTFTASASDANLPGQQLTWSLLPGAPPGAGIGAANGLFGWVPAESDGGNAYFVSIKVEDNGVPPLSATQTFIVTVIETNNAPSLSMPGDALIPEGQAFQFTALAADPDTPAQTLTFTLDPATAPAGASLHPATGVFTWQPSEAQGPGAYSVVVRVQDNGTPALGHSASISIIVAEVNAGPTLAPITNRQALLGETITLTVSATDPDLPAQLLAYDFDVVPPSGATINATNGLFNWTANSLGTNTFVVRVVDDGSPGLSDVQSFQVVVFSPEITASISRSAENVALVWNGASGRSYAVLYKDSLHEAQWSELVTNIVTTNGVAGISDVVGTNAQRVYRIRLEP